MYNGIESQAHLHPDPFLLNDYHSLSFVQCGICKIFPRALGVYCNYSDVDVLCVIVLNFHSPQALHVWMLFSKTCTQTIQLISTFQMLSDCLVFLQLT